jgi:hypothetical protein
MIPPHSGCFSLCPPTFLLQISDYFKNQKL